MIITFLGTGGAWGLPEMSCECMICKEMRRIGEKRQRTAILLSGKTNLLVDCGPDIGSQLTEHHLNRLDGILITHEHIDHYIGMDELVTFKRGCPVELFKPTPVYLTPESWKVISKTFGYLETTGVIEINEIEADARFNIDDFEVIPFKTNHGPYAVGSVGYIIKALGKDGNEIRLVYTSDLIDVPESHPNLFQPDYLIISAYWFNEPVENRANQLSFQKALEYIRLWNPKKETFLVHIGDGDRVKGDPANDKMTKKCRPINPLNPTSNDEPYPIPMNQNQWQTSVDQVVSDMGLPFKITVAYDGMTMDI